MQHDMTMTLAEKINHEVFNMIHVAQVNDELIGTVKPVTFNLGNLKKTSYGNVIEFVSNDVKLDPIGFFGLAFEAVAATVQVDTKCHETAYGDFFNVSVRLGWSHRGGGTNGHRLEFFWHVGNEKLMTREEITREQIKAAGR